MPSASRPLAWASLVIVGLLLLIISGCQPDDTTAADRHQGPDAQSEGEVDLPSVATIYRRARAGDAESQNRVGKGHATGVGLPKDLEAAEKWFRAAAEQAHAEGQYNLGMLLMDVGEAEEARYWLRKASGNGIIFARYRLAQLLRTGQGSDKDEKAAAVLYRSAAESGHTLSQYNLGLMYQLGIGVAQDWDKAASWYEKAAEAGLAEAQTKMGLMSHAGQGVPQDDAQAVKWFQLAAKDGHGVAQSNLGTMYAAGKGTAADPVKALAWFYLAAGNGISEAQEWATVLSGQLSNAQNAEARALAAKLVDQTRR